MAGIEIGPYQCGLEQLLECITRQYTLSICRLGLHTQSTTMNATQTG